MTQEFEKNTVAIILNEMFNDSKKLKTQMQFNALTEAYAERIVKLFFIPDVSISLEQAKKYAAHQHYRGTIQQPLIEFEDWQAKD
jgi:hypothetical protein